MTFVTHGKPGNFSRPRELLERRSKERLLASAEKLGFTDFPPRVTKEDLIEMITTDGALGEGEGPLRGATEEEAAE